jgi:hypothetical protein
MPATVRPIDYFNDMLAKAKAFANRKPRRGIPASRIVSEI